MSKNTILIKYRSKFENYILRNGQASPMKDLFKDSRSPTNDPKTLQHDTIPFLEKFHKI